MIHLRWRIALLTRGSFRKRFPHRCNICRKPSGELIENWWLDCGHNIWQSDNWNSNKHLIAACEHLRDAFCLLQESRQAANELFAKLKELSRLEVSR